MPPFLVIDRLVVSYDGAPILHEVSLNAAEAAVTAIVGPNGAGKSTLLHCVVGVIAPQQGQVTISGIQIQRLRPHRVVRYGVTLVPEGRRVFPEMSVEDNLLVGAHRLRRRKAIRAALLETYERFPLLRQWRHKHAGHLSGGQQQLLVIARALMGHPRFLMIDEPSLGLAPLVVKVLAEAVSELKANGLTIMLAEQNVAFASRIADYMFVLDNGVIEAEGAPRDLSQSSIFVDAYLGGKAAHRRPTAIAHLPETAPAFRHDDTPSPTEEGQQW